MKKVTTYKVVEYTATGDELSTHGPFLKAEDAISVFSRLIEEHKDRRYTVHRTDAHHYILIDSLNSEHKGRTK